MAKIRPANEIAEKWGEVTPQRTAQYSGGIQNPLSSWQASTAAAVGNYEMGISKSIANKSFGKGVAKAGDERWQAKSLQLGVGRWAPGVQAATGDYEQGFAPYRDAIEKVNLPPRAPRGDPRNYARVQAIGEALNKKKLAG